MFFMAMAGITWAAPPTSSDNFITFDEDQSYTFLVSDFPYSDPDGDPLGSIKIISTAVVGTLKLNDAPVANDEVIPQTEIAAGHLVFIPQPNGNGTPYDNIQFTVSDGVEESSPANAIAINVNPVNDEPVFNILGNQTINENDGPQSISNFATDIDDGDPEVDQTLTFETTVNSTTGNLAFSTAPAIDAATGALTFTTVANTNGQANITVLLRDNGATANGGQNEKSLAFTLFVTPVNEPPTFTLNGDPPAVNEDSDPQTVASYAQDIDDGDPELTQVLTFILAQTATTGNIAFDVPPAMDASSGNLTYSLTANTYGTATFSVVLKDDGPDQAVSTAKEFTLTVNAINHPPTGANETITMDEDAIYNFAATDFSFSDIDGQTFSGIQVISLPTDGELNYNGVPVVIDQRCNDITKLAFTPTPDENGTGYATFNFKVQDSNGDISVADYTMTINVNPVPDNPVGANGSINTQENLDYTFQTTDFSFNDADNDPYAGIELETNVAKGTLLYNSSPVSTFPTTIADVTKLVFSPGNNENGTPYTSFTFKVKDNSGALSTDSYTMSINVGAVNNPPVGSDETVDMLEDQVYAYKPGDFTFSDADNDAFAGIQVITVETAGDLEYNGADVNALDICADVTKLTFSPASDANGMAYATFTFKVRDNSGNIDLSTASYTMTINVTAVNDAPSFVIASNNVAVDEDAGAQSIANFASGISDGDPEAAQALTFGLTPGSITGNLTFAGAPAIDNTGKLTFNSDANKYGTAVFNVVLSDNGGTANGGQNTSATRQFTITVNPVNDPPTLADISDPAAINEDAGEQIVNLSGITAGSYETQTISITATSSNPSLIPNPSVNYTSPDNTGVLRYTPIGNANGTATINVKVDDGQPGSSSITKTFTVTVNPVNDPPTLDAVPDLVINENDGKQTVNLSGISAGPGENQTISISATSDNTALIADPAVTYSSPDDVGSLSFTPLANQSGTAKITVTVDDGQSTNNTFSQVFKVTVNEVNNPPTLDDIASPVNVQEDAPEQTVTLSGISAGAGETQTLVIKAISDSPAIIPNPTIDYTSGPLANLKFKPVANANGSANITVTIDDQQSENNTISKTFTVNVASVNDPPTLDAIADPVAINEDAPQQSINLTGISAGGGENQSLDISASSDVPGFFSNLTVNYSSGSTGTLTYTPAPDKFGVANITVTIDDHGGTNNLTTRTFKVMVNSINDPPTLNAISDPAPIDEDAPQQSVSLSGISAGDGESQTLTVSAKSDKPGIVPNPTVDYSGGTTASLSYAPVANAFGTATITVTVNDGAANNNLVTRTFQVVVNPVNDPPTLDPIADPAAIDEGAGLQTIGLTGISAGPNETQTLKISAVSSNTGLIPTPTINYTSGTTGTLTYTPVAKKNGAANITITVDDQSATNNLVSQSFTVTVDAVNDPPTFDLQPNPAVTENSGLNSVTGFAYNLDDGDPDETQGLSFDVQITKTTGNLVFDQLPTVSAATGQLTFKAKDNTNGTATVSIKLLDTGVPQASSATKTFIITVTPLNGNPSFSLNGNPPTVNEDVGSVTVNGFATNIDDGDPELTQALAFSVQPVNATGLIFKTAPAINAGNGNLTYEPAANANGTASFSVLLKDNGTPVAQSDPHYFTITVNPVDDPPTGGNATLTTDEDTKYTFKPSDFTFSDIDGQLFGGIRIASLVSSGSLKYQGSDVTLNQDCADVTLLAYNPAANQSGNNVASFGFKVRDAKGNVSISDYTAMFNITPEPDAPTSTNNYVNTEENKDYNFKESDFPFFDPDPGDKFSGVKITALETRGKLLNNNGDVALNDVITDVTKLVFEPAQNENGTPYTTFKFQVLDNTGNVSVDSYTMSIGVGAINFPPTGGNGKVTTLEDKEYTFQASDFKFNDQDNDAFAGIQMVSDVNNGELVYNGTPVTPGTNYPDVTKLVFKPNKDDNGTPYTTFSFKVRDNSGILDVSILSYTMTINVTAVNDAPTFTVSDPPATNEDDGAQTVANFAQSISDGDPEADQKLKFDISVTPKTGNLTFSNGPKINEKNGTLTYTADANKYGSVLVDAILSDDGGTANGGSNLSASQQFTIVVNPINDLPTIDNIPDPAAINEDAGQQSLDLKGISASMKAKHLPLPPFLIKPR